MKSEVLSAIAHLLEKKTSSYLICEVYDSLADKCLVECTTDNALSSWSIYNNNDVIHLDLAADRALGVRNNADHSILLCLSSPTLIDDIIKHIRKYETTIIRKSPT